MRTEFDHYYPRLELTESVFRGLLVLLRVWDYSFFAGLGGKLRRRSNTSAVRRAWGGAGSDGTPELLRQCRTRGEIWVLINRSVPQDVSKPGFDFGHGRVKKWELPQ